MHRRSFLRAAALAPGLAGLRALAWTADEPGGEDLASAHREASEMGLATLVFLRPADAAGRQRAGAAWGALFAGASLERLADLAVARRVAATRAELGALVGPERESALPDDARLVLLDAGAPPRCLGAAELPARIEEAWFARVHQLDALADAVGDLLHPDRETLARRARRFRSVQATRGPGGATAEARALATAFGELERALAEERPRRAREARLAAVEPFREELRERPVRRAALRPLPAPCPPPPVCAGGPCGTAFVPPRSRRFLEFFTAR